MGDTLVGCCGWAMAQAKYFATYPAIELQTTFYQPPANAVAQRWKAQAPPSFHFCMKAWQLITHTPASPTYRRLKQPVAAGERELYGSFRDTEQVWLAWERTREIASILDARVIVLQCPASFLPTRENLQNMRTFFRAIDRGQHALAWEPRGESWLPDLISGLCRDLDLIHCVDPLAATTQTPERIYWRLHGRTGYRYQYTDEDLAELRALLARHRDSDPLRYVLFNNMKSAEDAHRFAAQLAEDPNAAARLHAPGFHPS